LLETLKSMELRLSFPSWSQSGVSKFELQQSISHLTSIV
jgi:hypothetical protein